MISSDSEDDQCQLYAAAKKKGKDKKKKDEVSVEEEEGHAQLFSLLQGDQDLCAVPPHILRIMQVRSTSSQS